MIAVVALTAWGVWWSPLFSLDVAEIRVTVNSAFVTGAEVTSAVEPFVGTPLTRLDIEEVEDAVEALPPVLTAAASRRWPSGLAVVVTGREPVIAARQGDGQFVLLDAEAIRLGVVAIPPVGTPVVDLPLDEDNSRIVAAVVTVMAALPADLALRVESVTAVTEDGVTLILRDGPMIEWGSAEDSELKARVISVLLRSDAALAAVINVSAPTLPVTHD